MAVRNYVSSNYSFDKLLTFIRGEQNLDYELDYVDENVRGKCGKHGKNTN